MRCFWLGAALLIASCSETPPPTCTALTLDDGCAPQYQPTFANVYANTIKPDCGASRGACHTDGGDSTLSFATEQSAYDNLLRDYVTAGNPECSEMIVRITDVGEDYTMPKGDSLGESERCALQKWVRAGAMR